VYHIKSRATNEYLYAGNEYLEHDQQRRKVFTWVKTNKQADPNFLDKTGETKAR